MTDKKVGIYVRISKDREGAGLGVARQEKESREKARQLGWTVDRVYIDNDISAYQRRKPRQHYEQLLRDIESGVIDRLIVWHTDRLHRNNRELERFIDVAGECEVHAVKSGPLELATASGRMAARILGAVAQHESEQKSERQQSKARQDAERGVLKRGGTRGYGYERDGRTVRADEADNLRDAARRILLGASLRGICQEWNDAGVKTVTGKPWSSQVLRRALVSPKNAGWREHKGVPIIKGEWEAIFTEEEHQQLKTVLEDPARQTNGGKMARKYLLTGILYCGHCGQKFRARPTGTRVKSYVCAGVGIKGHQARVQAEPLDDLIQEAVLIRFESPDFGKAVGDSDAAAEYEKHAKRLLNLDQRLRELEDDYRINDVVDRPTYQRSRERLLSERDKVEIKARNSMGNAAIQSVGGGDLRAHWDAEGREWRRALIESVVDRIVVGAGRRGYNRFDPKRVTIEWRV